MKTWGGVFQAEKLACARALGWGGAGESETQQGGQCGCSIEREGGRVWMRRGRGQEPQREQL